MLYIVCVPDKQAMLLQTLPTTETVMKSPGMLGRSWTDNELWRCGEYMDNKKLPGDITTQLMEFVEIVDSVASFEVCSMLTGLVLQRLIILYAAQYV